MGLVDGLLEIPPARWLRLKDLVIGEDLVDAGWERWELRRAKRGLGNGVRRKNQ